MKWQCPEKSKCLVSQAEDGNSTDFDIHEGVIEGQAVSQILIDNACNRSQVHPRWLKTTGKTREYTRIKGSTAAKRYPLVLVKVRVKGRSFYSKMAVNGDISFDAILGVDIPYVRALMQKGEEWPRNDDDEISVPRDVPTQEEESTSTSGSSEERASESESDTERRRRRRKRNRKCAPPRSYEPGLTEEQIQEAEEEDSDDQDKAPEGRKEEENEATDDSEESQNEGNQEPLEEGLPPLDDSLFVQHPKEDRPKHRKASRKRGSMQARWGMRIPLEGGRDQLMQAQASDPSLHECRRKAQEEEDGEFEYENGVLLRKHEPNSSSSVQQVVLPRAYRETVLRLAHSSPFAGHFGRDKTAQKIAKNYYWPGGRRDVRDMVEQCHTCQVTARRNMPKYPLIPMPVMEAPFSRIATDIVGPLTVTEEGHRWILTVMDYGTRYPEAIAMKETSAEAVANELVQIFSRVGFPKETLTDRGSNFCSELSEELFKHLGIRHIRTSAYHPQTDGMVERFSGTMTKAIRKWVKTEGNEWNKSLPYLMFAYREIPHSTTGYSPFELLYGRQPRGPLDIMKEQWQEPTTHTECVISYLLKIYDYLQKATEAAKEKETEGKAAMKEGYD